MCCFSGTVRVSATSIFARGTDDGRQVLAYSMTVAAAEDVAMVLPLPVPPRTPDDAVRFIDLSGYPGLFADLRRGFPGPARLGAVSGSVMFGLPRLAVHDVGAFEASFVPRVADFDRLDRRFRLPDAAWDALPGYRDFGFAVFKLKGLGGGRALHPMAFEFPRRDPGALFFPIVHVHDGAVHATAPFDHTLYAQAADVAGTAWRRSAQPAAAFVHGDSRGLVDLASPCYQARLHGDLPNRDTVLVSGSRTPAGDD